MVGRPPALLRAGEPVPLPLPAGGETLHPAAISADGTVVAGLVGTGSGNVPVVWRCST